jgi:hypothetical protein
VKTLEFTDLAAYVSENSYPVRQDSLDEDGWSLAGGSAQALLQKLRAKGVPLGKLLDGKIYYGIKTGLNEAFIIDATTRRHLIASDPRSAELIKPFLMGRDVKRYETPEVERFLIFVRRHVDIQQYPAILEYLSPLKERLMPKPDNWSGKSWSGRKAGSYKWYEIQDPVEYHAEFEKPKIIVPAIVQNASYSFDTSGFYSNDKTSIIVSDSLYLLGILNSKTLDFVMHSIASTKQGGYYEYKPMYVEQLPIRTINFDDPADIARHDRMVQMVEQMIALKQEHAREEVVFSDKRHELAQRIERLDQDIDALVYELYGLTDDELAIVEGRG